MTYTNVVDHGAPQPPRSDPLTAALGIIRHRPDRWLHRVRHRRAMAIVRERLRGPGRHVLVVCYGNICRSPYAAAVIRRALEPLGLAVDSAGIVGANRPIPAPAHESALRRGEDLSAHRSKLLSPRLAHDASLIVVMDPAQRDHVLSHYAVDPSMVVLFGDLDPAPIEKRAIRDPYGQVPAVFEEVFARIDRCARVVAECAFGNAVSMEAGIRPKR